MKKDKKLDILILDPQLLWLLKLIPNAKFIKKMEIKSSLERLFGTSNEQYSVH